MLFHKKVQAFPVGAGGCAGGMPAVSGFHLNITNGRNVMGASLTDGAILVQIGSTLLNASAVVRFPVGEDLPISVAVNSSDLPYKGVLVRLEAPAGVSTSAALMPGMNTDVAEICFDPIIGITHTDNSTKTVSAGTIRFDEEVSNVTLDITVVFINDVNFSAFAYDRFTVTFTAAASPITAPPTPMATPIMSPISAVSPIASPTALTPVAFSDYPSRVPFAVPVPISITSESPSRVPAAAPVPISIASPVPTSGPVPIPTVSPIAIPPTGTDPTPTAGMKMGMKKKGGVMDVVMDGGMRMGGGVMGMGGGVMGMGGGMVAGDGLGMGGNGRMGMGGNGRMGMGRMQVLNVLMM